MKILRITVKKDKDGNATYRVQGRDDAGNPLDTTVTVLPGGDAAVVVQQALQSLAVVATEVTEEEDYNAKSSK